MSARNRIIQPIDAPRETPRGLPSAYQAALEARGASPALWHCALDLWLRTRDGAFVAPPTVCAAMVDEANTVVDAANVLVGAGLLEEVPSDGEDRVWRWLIDSADVPTKSKPTNAAVTQGALSDAEREQILNNRITP